MSQRLVVHWIAKPTAVLLIIFLTSILPSNLSSLGYKLFLLALVLSLMGDIFMMIPNQPLIRGLLTFLCAHIVFITAYTLQVPWQLQQALWLILAFGIGAITLLSLWRSLNRMRVPVILYIAIMATLFWRLIVRFPLAPDIGLTTYSWGVVGGAAFILSDTLLAHRRLAKRNVPYALELGSYFFAIACLARTTWVI